MAKTHKVKEKKEGAPEKLLGSLDCYSLRLTHCKHFLLQSITSCELSRCKFSEFDIEHI